MRVFLAVTVAVDEVVIGTVTAVAGIAGPMSPVSVTDGGISKLVG
jgi:hypothetical protein